jgi:hypothetical protein
MARGVRLASSRPGFASFKESKSETQESYSEKRISCGRQRQCAPLAIAHQLLRKLDPADVKLRRLGRNAAEHAFRSQQHLGLVFGLGAEVETTGVYVGKTFWTRTTFSPVWCRLWKFEQSASA